MELFMEVTKVGDFGSSIILIEGHPGKQVGDDVEFDTSTTVTIGVDHRMAGPIAEHLQSWLTGEHNEGAPVVTYESWAVLGTVVTAEIDFSEPSTFAAPLPGGKHG